MDHPVEEGFSVKLVMALGSLILLAIVAFLVSRLYVTIQANSTQGLGAEDNAAMLNEVVGERIAKVGAVDAGKPDTAPKVLTGEEVVESTCAQCHQMGILSAPKIGSNEDWAPRAANGYPALLKSALEGKGDMPARGGNPSLSDDNIKAGISFMLSEAGIDMEAPVGAVVDPMADAEKESDPLVRGEAIYASACIACHDTGVAGAPKVSDAAAWEAREAKGIDALVETVMTGKGAMPPKGGRPDLNMIDVKHAVLYVLHRVEEEAKAPATESAPQPAAAAEPVAAEAVAEAEPEAESAADHVAAAAPQIDLAKGEEIYKAACMSCHSVGIAGAPRLDDAAAWADRLPQGLEQLAASAINGKGAMPPKGGRADFSDADITTAVGYMINAVK